MERRWYFTLNRSNSKRKLKSNASTVEVKKMRKIVRKGGVEQIIREDHEEIGHLMQNKTYAHVKQRFYWDRSPRRCARIRDRL
ncbi:hypothetical protein Aduo_006257 [Ancylostoma duodenale]